MSPSKIYGLIGYPVKHSLSPRMHNAAFEALKINAEYKLFEVKPHELADFLSSLTKNNIYGLNVTIPHKESALSFIELDKESFYLRRIGAVNTIALEGARLKGFNTDVPGFAKDLEEKNIGLTNKEVAILGGGGAAKAVAYALAKKGAKAIFIYDIDKKKSEEVVQMLKKKEPGEDFSKINIRTVDSIEQLEIRKRDMLINATPVGMKDTDPLLVEKKMLHKGLFVYDLIYNPPETKLLSLAKKIGARYSNGLGMLLYQGALSFKHFTAQDAPIEVMRSALEKGVRKDD